MPERSRRYFLRVAVAATVCSLVRAARVEAAPNSREVTARASRYVAWYDEQMTALVAEERYVQRRTGPSEDGEASMRELWSDIGWIQVDRLADAVAVREVRQVDRDSRSPVGRLRRLLEQPGETPASQVQEILDESAAYNLETGALNINFPTFPLTYLRERYAGRSRWRLTGEESGRRVLSFRERQRPTIVRTAAGDHLRARGRFWIDDESGRVERCDIRVDGLEEPALFLRQKSGLTGSYEMAVTFAHDTGIDLWVPIQMNEIYQRKKDRQSVRVTGEATYFNYRRFRTEGRLLPTSP